MGLPDYTSSLIGPMGGILGVSMGDEGYGPGKPRVEADPSGMSLNTPGAKADAGKLMPDLVFDGMANALHAVVEVASAGAVKYSEGGWMLVPDGFKRYNRAQGRHQLKRAKGETHDKDSGSLHLAHEAWNALAKLELYIRDNRDAS